LSGARAHLLKTVKKRGEPTAAVARRCFVVVIDSLKRQEFVERCRFLVPENTPFAG
jgi:hypothetical protein